MSSGGLSREVVSREQSLKRGARIASIFLETWLVTIFCVSFKSIRRDRDKLELGGWELMSLRDDRSVIQVRGHVE